MVEFLINSKNVRGQAEWSDGSGVVISVDWREAMNGGVTNISGHVRVNGDYAGDFSGQSDGVKMVYTFNGMTLERMSATALALNDIESRLTPAAASEESEATEQEATGDVQAETSEQEGGEG